MTDVIAGMTGATTGEMTGATIDATTANNQAIRQLCENAGPRAGVFLCASD